jgi:hypothetical protein
MSDFPVIANVVLTPNFNKHQDDAYNPATQWWIPTLAFFIGLVVPIIGKYGFTSWLNGKWDFAAVLFAPFIYIWIAAVWIVKHLGKFTHSVGTVVAKPITSVTTGVVSVIPGGTNTTMVPDY